MNSFVDFFKHKQTSALGKKLDIPSDLWEKCPSCGEILYKKALDKALKVCAKCNYHFRMNFKERISLLCDQDSFKEFNIDIKAIDFLNFCDKKKYSERIKENQKKSGLNDAVLTGEATINKMPVMFICMDFSFMGGSMGSVVGEKIVRAINLAIQKKMPVLAITVSGGARMQEGIVSLMQMAKTSASISKLKENNLLYLVLLTDPTTGGTTASFAMLGDIHLAEPGALIGFAGPRVIEQTIRQKLPSGFQKAEYLLEHGMVDMVVSRKDLKEAIAKILTWAKN